MVVIYGLKLLTTLLPGLCYKTFIFVYGGNKNMMEHFTLTIYVSLIFWSKGQLTTKKNTHTHIHTHTHTIHTKNRALGLRPTEKPFQGQTL